MLVICLKRQIELSGVAAQQNIFHCALHQLKALCDAIRSDCVAGNAIVMKAVVAVIPINFELIIAFVEAKISIGLTAVVLCRGINDLGAVFDVAK